MFRDSSELFPPRCAGGYRRFFPDGCSDPQRRRHCPWSFRRLYPRRVRERCSDSVQNRSSVDTSGAGKPAEADAAWSASEDRRDAQLIAHPIARPPEPHLPEIARACATVLHEKLKTECRQEPSGRKSCSKPCPLEWAHLRQVHPFRG